MKLNILKGEIKKIYRTSSSNVPSCSVIFPFGLPHFGVQCSRVFVGKWVVSCLSRWVVYTILRELDFLRHCPVGYIDQQFLWGAVEGHFNYCPVNCPVPSDANILGGPNPEKWHYWLSFPLSSYLAALQSAANLLIQRRPWHLSKGKQQREPSQDLRFAVRFCITMMELSKIFISHHTV